MKFINDFKKYKEDIRRDFILMIIIILILNGLLTIYYFLNGKLIWGKKYECI